MHFVVLCDFKAVLQQLPVTISSSGIKKNIPSRYLRFNIEKSSHLFLFEFLCCIEVYEAKWCNPECLNPFIVTSKYRSFNDSV